MKFNVIYVHNLVRSFIFLIPNMNTNMNTRVWNMHMYRVFILESRTENPCVGGSIPPLGTTPKAFKQNPVYEHLWTLMNTYEHYTI